MTRERVGRFGRAAILGAVASVAVVGTGESQVVPQRGRVDTEMRADSLSGWSVWAGAVGSPVVRGEAFDEMGGGFGGRAGVGATFAGGFALGIGFGWTGIGDDLSGGTATLAEVLVELWWAAHVGAWRLEGGPMAGLVRLDRDDLEIPATGGLAGVGARLRRPISPRLQAGLSADLLWAGFGELQFLVETPPDPDGRSDGLRLGFGVHLAVVLGGGSPGEGATPLMR